MKDLYEIVQRQDNTYSIRRKIDGLFYDMDSNNEHWWTAKDYIDDCKTTSLSKVKSIYMALNDTKENLKVIDPFSTETLKLEPKKPKPKWYERLPKVKLK